MGTPSSLITDRTSLKKIDKDIKVLNWTVRAEIGR